jgi:hypothetical protein
MPIFIFLLFVFIEFGRVLWIRSVLNEAASEGARLAMLHGPSDYDVQQVVKHRLIAQGVEYNYLITIGPREPGRPVVVTVEADLDLMLLPDGPLKKAEITKLRASSVMTHVY